MRGGLFGGQAPGTQSGALEGGTGAGLSVESGPRDPVTNWGRALEQVTSGECLITILCDADVRVIIL
jgi:hypothetical protein